MALTKKKKLFYLSQSQIIQGGLQAQLGPGTQSAPLPMKEIDESLTLSIHQVCFVCLMEHTLAVIFSMLWNLIFKH